MKSLGYPIVLTSPENAEELSKAIENLHNNKTQMKAMSEKGKIIVSDNFTWDINGINTYKFLENTIEVFQK